MVGFSFTASIVDSLALKVEARRLPPSPRPVMLPAADDDFAATEDLGYAEGQSFVITYVNSSGERSVRRITVWSTKRGAAGVPLLIAKCHERRRTVTFRVDRIESCIDFDGEVFENVPAFLYETLGMPLDTASRTADSGDQDDWDSFRAVHLPHLVLLAALSNADAEMVPEEVGVIVDYCAAAFRRMGGAPSDAFRRIAASYIRRVRPRAEDIARSIDALMVEGPDIAVDFLRAAAQVVDADGRRHPAEIDMINELARELIGVEIA